MTKLKVSHLSYCITAIYILDTFNDRLPLTFMNSESNVQKKIKWEVIQREKKGSETKAVLVFLFLFVAFGVVLDEVRHPATDRQNGKILLPLNVIIIHQCFSVIICHINKHAEVKGFHVQEV